MRKFIIVSLILITIIAASLYFAKVLLLDKAKTILIEKIESLTGRGATIEEIGYMPVKGFRLKGLTVYEDLSLDTPILSIRDSYIKFSLMGLIKNKKFAPKITLHRLQVGDVFINGGVSFSMNVAEEIASPRNFLDSIDILSLYDFSVVTPSIVLEKINGSIFVDPKLIKSSDITFVFNDTSGKIDFKVTSPLDNLSSSLVLSSKKFNLTSRITGEKELYKIQELNGSVFDSSFDFTGEFRNSDGGNLSLYGTTKISLKDVSYFSPEKFRNSIESLGPQGEITSSVYFNGKINDLSSCELGIKSKAESLNIYKIKIADFRVDARLKDKILTLPLIQCFIYGGAFISEAEIDFTNKSLPFSTGGKLSNFNLSTYFDSTNLKNNAIAGLVSIDFKVHGDLKNPSSQKGSGSISITDANLGPMPILSPVVGYGYSYLHKLFPKLRKVDITSGFCTFIISDQKINTDDLALHGEMMNIYAKGYMDFDRNLDFLVKNEFVKPEKKEVSDWQSGLQELLVNTSNFINDAHLTGTLEKPKWEFKYLAGMKNVLEGGLGKAFKDILR
ncbi:MAG: hypothetical protein ABIH57_00305 [Candidatus Omnitrophota bacterium]